MKKKVLAAMLVCALIMCASPALVVPAWARLSGSEHISRHSLGSSPFTAVTSDSASEQAKAALKAQIDASDPSYNRAKTESEKANNQRAFDVWVHGATGSEPLIKLGSGNSIYTGVFRSYNMTGGNLPSSSQPTNPTPTPTPDLPASSVYVTIDLNDGSPVFTTPAVTIGEYLKLTQTRPGYTFAGWLDENGNRVTSGSSDLGGHTIIAQWTKNGSEQNPATPAPAPTPTMKPNPTETTGYIYFDFGDGTPVEKYAVSNTFMFDYTFAQDGYIFLGWFDEDGNQVTAPSADLAGKTLTAHWTEE